jgi:hypothetical protein
MMTLTTIHTRFTYADIPHEVATFDGVETICFPSVMECTATATPYRDFVAIDLEEGFWDTALVHRILTIDDAVQFFVDVLIDAE